jgi:secreted trypsin-like serine protease
LRIIGGTPALEGEFNECCLIGKRNPNGTIDWFCTGVLIHPRVVVSAAHCVVAGQPYVVALETNSQNNLSNAKLVNTRKTIVHPNYVSQTHLYDLSVLVLQAEATTPPAPLVTTEIISNASEVELVGFGNDHITLNQGFGIKRKVFVDIVSIRRNPNEDLNLAESTYGYESDLEFVAGGKGFDTCNGDSGGPVYINHSNQRWVAGLTSRASDNRVNPSGDGGIYTPLDIHTPFINSIIQNL